MSEVTASQASQSKISQASQISIPKIKIPPLLFLAAILTTFWFLPTPAGLNTQAWHLFGIFLTTLVGIAINASAMGALTIIALAICTITETLTIKQALSSFSSHIVWLILIAFILARGFIKTGLGSRIAYYFVLSMGKSTLGLSYGLISTELLLAPFTPSNTARGAGIVYPIVSSLAKEYGSCPSLGTERKIGGFLMKLAYQTNVITSAMFLTAMVGNPLILSMASKMGVEISWTTWALAACVPGILCLAILPLILTFFYPPEIRKTPEAPQFARKKLDEMGPMKKAEWIMLGTFALLLVLWVLGKDLNIDATTTAILGLAILLSTGVLTWDDVLKEHNAWHTFVWLTILLMMSNFLTEFGMMSWLSNHLQSLISTLPWILALGIVLLIYFYSHYSFASITAHIGALYTPFALLAIAAGTPPIIAVLLLSFFSSLCAGITHYGTGTAPVYFGSAYVTLKDWWRMGAIISVINILIWVAVGPLWWKVIGLW